MQQTDTTPTPAAPTLDSSLNDWLTYIYSIHVSAIDMGLSRVLPVFAKLGIEQTSAYVFTVAGTNGKGSTTSTIAAICQQAGYKTALYQSPELLVFNERVKINGDMVDDQTLIAAFDKVEQARLACGVTLSFFEMTTLAAMVIFAEQHCDVWVLEIGLGGRLDVVNVIDPDLAVITNIGIDHVDWLGDTREKISIEKAGILREGIPLIYGEMDMPSTILPLIEQQHVTLWQYGRDYFYQSVDNVAESDLQWQPQCQSQWQYSHAGMTLSLPLPQLSLPNTATAISAVLASGLAISPVHIAQALPQVKLAGRFDKRTMAKRHWVFDVAHNEHGIHFLLQQFLPYWQQYQAKYPTAKLYLVVSMLADKDIDTVFGHLKQLPFEKVLSAPIAHTRAASKALLEQKLSQYFDSRFELYEDFEAVAEQVINISCPDDLILVCGSFHTISEMLKSKALTGTN